MNFTKTLTSSVAAVALVGAIGFAYAQSSTTDTTVPATATSPTQRMDGSNRNTRALPQPRTETPVQTAPTTMPAETTAPAPAVVQSTPAQAPVDTMTDTQRAPQADRN